MSRWPPILWLCIFAGSVFLLNGWDGEEFNPQALIPGIVLILAGAAGSFWLAFRRYRDRPQNPGVAWLVPATVVFYLACAIAGSAAGGAYAIAAIAAGLIPFTAASLLVATTRAKTVEAGGRRREADADADEDPYPGIGADDETPLGDTPEHSDAERVARPDDRFTRRGETRAR